MSKRKLSSKSQYAIVVLGMHRSGTSALAGIFGRLGCDLPEMIMPANEFNPKGFNESIKVCQLNDAILASGGSSWDDWAAFNPGWFESPLVESFLNRATDALQQEYGGSPLFVLKDPRICRLMPFWRRFFDEAEINPAYVLTHRDPIKVAQSLQNREGWPLATGLLLWLRHTLEAESGSRGKVRCFTSYDRLLNRWSAEMSTVQSRIGISFPRFSDSIGLEIDDFLNIGSPNRGDDLEAVTNNPLLSTWVRRVFAILDRWAEVGEQETDYAELDTICAEFNSATPMFSSLIQALGSQADKTAEALAAMTSEWEVERQNAAEVEQLRGDLAARQAALVQVQAQQVETEQHNAQRTSQLEAKVGQLHGDLAARQAALVQVQAQQVETEQHNAQRTSQLEAKVGQLRGDLAARQEALVQVQAQQVETEQHNAQRTSQLEAKVGQLRGDLAARQEALVQVQAQQAETEQHNAQRTSQLEAKAEQLRGDLAARQEALVQVQAQQVETEQHNARIINELDEKIEQFQELHKELEEAKQDHWQIKSELAQRSQEAEDMGRHSRENAESAKALAAQLAESQSEHAVLLKSRDQVDKSARMMRVKLKEEFEFELATVLAGQRRHADAQRAQLNTEIQALDTELQAFRKDEKFKRGEFQRLTEDRDRSVAEREQLAEDLRRQQESIAALEHMNAAYVNSTSWKITAPLRRIITVLRGQS